MAFGIDLRADTLRSLDFSLVPSGSFTAIGGPLANPARLMIIQNATDALLTFSFASPNSPANPNFVLFPMGQLIIDVTTNRINDGGFYISTGTTVYVGYSFIAPTKGDVYVSAFYAKVT